MTYNKIRNRAIRDALGRRIEDFARRYRPGSPTVVLIPGGMGSQLDRSQRRYRGKAGAPLERYDPVWMDYGILFDNDALELEMTNAERDVGDHIIIPDGPLDFFVNAYDGTKQFFEVDCGWNYICFGYDWRRPITEWSSYLEYFLKRLNARVKQIKGEFPLPTTTLLCHSMGGLVATAFLHRLANSTRYQSSEFDKWLYRVVTVATPFYGTSTHIRRYYKGQSALNWIYGATTVARIAGSLPGPYILMFLDRMTYQRDGSELNKSKFPLKRYPMREAGNEDVEVDPYGSTATTRYPLWVQSSYLRKAKEIRSRITNRLPDEIAERVFHIRSGLVTMPIEQVWRSVNGSAFNPDRNSHPIHKSSKELGPGDGTVPAWSARLASTPLANVYNLTQARQHTDLAEHRETLEVVAWLMEHGELPGEGRVHARGKQLGVAKAPRQQMNAWLSDVMEGKWLETIYGCLRERCGSGLWGSLTCASLGSQETCSCCAWCCYFPCRVQ